VFKNPLADPFLLGSAAGAGLGVTLIIVYNINFSFFIIHSVQIGAPTRKPRQNLGNLHSKIMI
jgi:ABC-type Fe3+-siderophore transport system permease subunit